MAYATRHYLDMRTMSVACDIPGSVSVTQELARVTCEGCLRALRRVPMPESALLSAVRHTATASGYLVYHTHRSDRSPAGFPDLVLARPGRLIFAETKSATGKLTMEQQRWLDMLLKTVAGVEVAVWRPHDLPSIFERLR